MIKIILLAVFLNGCAIQKGTFNPKMLWVDLETSYPQENKVNWGLAKNRYKDDFKIK